MLFYITYSILKFYPTFGAVLGVLYLANYNKLESVNVTTCQNGLLAKCITVQCLRLSL